jgi:hypothetical protein
MNPHKAVFLFGLLLTGVVHASNLSGTWTAEGVTVTLTQSSDQVSGTLVTDRKSASIGGVAEGNSVFGELSGPQGSIPLTLTLTGATLKLELTADGAKPQVFFLKRSGAAAARAAATPPAARVTPTPAPPPDVPKAGAGPAPAAATGGVWKNATEGWTLRAPAGWKGSEAPDGAVNLGHDKEHGILRITHVLGQTLQGIQRDYGSGFTLEQVAFSLAGPVSSLKVKAGPALTASFTGMSAVGEMRVHAAAVQGPLGTVLISGIAPAANFGRMATHVESMAASVVFTRAKVQNTMQLVAGTWWHWKGSSSTTYGSNSSYVGYSSEKKLWLCPDGRFSRSGSFSVDASTRSENADAIRYGSAARNSADASEGRWTAVGTRDSGVVSVTLSDGSTQRLPYRRAAPGDEWQIYFDGFGYAFDKGMGGCN